LVEVAWDEDFSFAGLGMCWSAGLSH